MESKPRLRVGIVGCGYQRRIFNSAADTGALVVGQHFIPFLSL